MYAKIQTNTIYLDIIYICQIFKIQPKIGHLKFDVILNGQIIIVPACQVSKRAAPSGSWRDRERLKVHCRRCAAQRAVAAHEWPRCGPSGMAARLQARPVLFPMSDRGPWPGAPH
jgi:hypothetical protein